FPDDGPLLVALGTAIETMAGESPTWPETERALARSRLDREENLKEAAALFDRALLTDISFPEARVRRAHVHILEHEDGQAAALLDQVLTSDPSATWKYLARLMLGGIRERAGDPASASRLYV